MTINDEESEFESWDADPDFLLPPSLHLPLPHDSSSLENVSIPPTPLHDESTTTIEGGSDFFSQLDEKLLSERTGGDRTREEESSSSIDSRSTESTTGTLKGLMDSLSLGGDEGDEADKTVSFDDIEREELEEEKPKKSTKMMTLRPGSDLSQLLALANGSNSTSSSSPRGKVHHLGSTPRGEAKEVGKGDWDQDLDLEGFEAEVGDDEEGLKRRRSLGKKASWTSHISIEDDDHEEEQEQPNSNIKESTPSTTDAVVRPRLSIASFKDEEEDFSDLDFDLPTSQSHFEISPSLSLQRPSMTSLRSESRAPPTPSTDSPLDLKTLPLSRREASSDSTATTLSTTSPSRPPPLPLAHSSLSTTTQTHLSRQSIASNVTDTEDEAEDEEESDSEFFQDLELPPYFLNEQTLSTLDSSNNNTSHARGSEDLSCSPFSSASSSRGGGKGMKGDGGFTTDGRSRRGGMTTTPPTSDGETDDAFLNFSPSPIKHHQTNPTMTKKIDLQQLLKEKLKLRGGRGLLFHGSSPTTTLNSGSSASSTTTNAVGPSPTKEQLLELEKHREKEGEEVEVGKELSLSRSKEEKESSNGKKVEKKKKSGGRSGGGGGDETEEESWNAAEMRERMRTISGARAREAAAARSARAAAGTGGRGSVGGMRRTVSMSGGKVPPLPTTNRTGQRPTTMKRSDTSPNVSGIGSTSTTTTIGRSGLSRSGSSMSVASQPASLPSNPRSSLPHITRPSSAQGVATNPSTSTAPRKGPPPAPSTASRDRVRMRTISLRTVGSTSDLRAASNAPTTTARRPTKLNLDTASNRSLSPVPMTPGPTSATVVRATPSPGPARSLTSKRSHQQLRLTTPSSSRTIERKRSLQNLTSHDLPGPPPTSTSRPTSRQSSLRSPSPARSTHSLISRPSFAAPTAASVSRIRERVQSNPHPLLPPQTALVPASPITSNTPSAANRTGRLLQPTLSSASKTRSISASRSPSKPSLSSTRQGPPSLSSGIRIPSQPLHISRPLTLDRRQPNKRSTEADYGDGTELDGFDDLPVSKEREKALIVVPSSSSGGSGHSKQRSTSRTSSSTFSSGGTTSRKSSAGSVSTVRGIKEEQGGGGIERRGSSIPKMIPKMISGLMSKKEGDKVKEREKGKKKRREPHLIRHLGTNTRSANVQGEMTYNPILQRWEGNESILREFDKVLSTSTRPALISPFSSNIGSPSRSAFPSPVLSAQTDSIDSRIDVSTSATPPAQTLTSQPLKAPSSSRGGVKVVGDMVFDPTTCSWHAIAGPEGEDELELDWGEVADDEEGGEGGGGDGWEKGERERMLKNRASFVLSEGEEESEEEVKDGERRSKMTKRGIWRESKRAEERCKDELKGWSYRPDEEEREDRSWLFELRALIVDSQ